MNLSIEPGIVSLDGAALADFYCQAFGFTVAKVLDFPQGLVYRLVNETAELKIFQPADAPTQADPGVGWNQVTGFRYAAVHVADARAAVESATRAGATLLTEVTNHRPGAWFALISDPDGNVMEILQEGAES